MPEISNEDYQRLQRYAQREENHKKYNAARRMATKRLIAAHEDEYNTYLEEEVQNA